MILAATLVAACVVRAAGADEPKTDAAAPAWGMQQLMQAMAETKSSQRKFTERKYVSVLTTPLDSSGYLVFKAPGHLEKHTLQPQDESMVLNQGLIIIENRSRHVKRTMMANQYPVVTAFVESIRATLAGDLNTLEHYYRVRLTGSAARWRLELTPNDPAAREVVREVVMQGHDKQMQTIEIIEANGDRSVMQVGDEMPAPGERQ